MIRIVCISDTHTLHEQIELPEGDVLVHAGDFCGNGSETEAREFARWFRSCPHRYKVVVAGNHDICIEDRPALASELFVDCTYLFDSRADVAGLRFYGAPWQPRFFDWAFNLDRGAPLREKWKLVHEGLDVLVTHGPPAGRLDRTSRDERVGCEELRTRVDIARPRVHVFGHVHEGYGTLEIGETLFVNASTCDRAYRPVNQPIVVDLEPRPERSV